MTSQIDYPLSLLYIESHQNYVELHYVNGKKKVIRSTMKSLLDQLPSEYFLRIHSKWIINLLRVNYYHGNSRMMEIKLTDCHIAFSVARDRISEFVDRIDQCDNEIIMVRNDPGYSFLS